MAYQIILSEADFNRLQTVSGQSGKPIETLIHEAIERQFDPPKKNHRELYCTYWGARFAGRRS